MLHCKSQEKFHIYHPMFATCNATKCCIASSKESITILSFLQCCKARLLHVHCNLQCNFVKNELIRAHLLHKGDIKLATGERVVNNFQRGVTSCKEILRTCDTPSATCHVFSRHLCIASCKKIVPCNMAFRLVRRNFAVQFRLTQPCQNVPAAGNFAAFSQLLAAYSTLNFTTNPLAGKGTWNLLPTTPAMLPTATQNILTGLSRVYSSTRS